MLKSCLMVMNGCYMNIDFFIYLFILSLTVNMVVVAVVTEQSSHRYV